MTTARLPEHLREYLAEQDPSLYTAIDHAAWRYIMRVSKKFFSEHGHPLYLHALEATGISTERIPLVQEIDQALSKFGWRAVVINGFIPPAIFLEFQSLKILAIACDMRKLENLGYTPSPDIVHEAAGHVPIVADPEYRSYLEAYGEVARNAIITRYDLELYDAIFKLSEIKEDPSSKPEDIKAAQKNFEKIAAKESKPSEAALLTRMAWWTTEYGLIGSIEKPLIYGAGLLSSVDESYNCIKPEVKKVPFSLAATIKTSYDITRPQPQLFVAKSFAELTTALNEFAHSMAFRKGGVYGLEVARQADNTVAVALDNGIQLSGIVSYFEMTPEGEEASFVLTGTKQIAHLHHANEEFTTHSMPQRLFVPLFEKSVSSANLTDIQRKLHGSGLHAKNGLRIQGRFKKEIDFNGTARVLILEQVKISDLAGKVVFEEKQKQYPLILASRILSVFGGAADRAEFASHQGVKSKKVAAHKTNLTETNFMLNMHYNEVRNFREQNHTNLEELYPIMNELFSRYPDDWLLRLELLEIFNKIKPDSVFTAQLRTALKEIGDKHSHLRDLVKRGLELV